MTNFDMLKVSKAGGTTTIAFEIPIHDYVKQLILFRARNRGMPELPMRIEDLPYGTAAESWYHALTNDNPPGKCRFDFRKDPEGFLAFKAEVESLDFSRYDAVEADILRAKYGTKANFTSANFDATDVEMED